MTSEREEMPTVEDLLRLQPFLDTSLRQPLLLVRRAMPLLCPGERDSCHDCTSEDLERIDRGRCVFVLSLQLEMRPLITGIGIAEVFVR